MLAVNRATAYDVQPREFGAPTTPLPIAWMDSGGQQPSDGGAPEGPKPIIENFFATPRSDREHFLPPPEGHDPFESRGVAETLVGSGLLDGLISEVITDGLSTTNDWHADTESLLWLPTKSNQGGFITLLSQDDGAKSGLADSATTSYPSFSSTTGWNASLQVSTDTAGEAEPGTPLRPFATIYGSVSSSLDDDNGGLIGLGAATATDHINLDSPSWETEMEFSLQPFSSRNDWQVEEEETESSELTDIVFSMDWNLDGQEGGMIELAAAHPHEVLPQDPVADSETVTSPGRDIRIDKGRGRFRVLEVAEATSELVENRALTQQAVDEDHPTSASAENATPTASAAAAAELSVEADHHAAAPAIVGLALVSIAGSETSQKRDVERRRSSRNHDTA